jgi:cell division protein FtsQ
MQAAAAAAPLASPDIRLMNHAAALLFALVLAALLVAGAGALARLPAFEIRSVRIEGDVSRNDATTIRANAMPKLSGSYFTLDLAHTKRVFEAVPWVRRATVSRIWPNRLAVRLEEHRAAALWGEDRLVNVQGEVFDANLGDIEDDALPVFAGPDGTSARMLAMHARLAPVFAQALQARIATLALSGRGSWRAELDSGATIELGRGSEAEVLARAERFVRTLPQLIAQYQRPLLAADLRHRDGYAARLRGVSTTTGAADPKR